MSLILTVFISQEFERQSRSGNNPREGVYWTNVPSRAVRHFCVFVIGNNVLSLKTVFVLAVHTCVFFLISVNNNVYLQYYQYQLIF